MLITNKNFRLYYWKSADKKSMGGPAEINTDDYYYNVQSGQKLHAIRFDGSNTELYFQVWLEASREVAVSQSYRVGSRSLTRADLGTIQKQIKYWQGVVSQLSRWERNRLYRAVPRDL
jgi:hypothetical protein